MVLVLCPVFIKDRLNLSIHELNLMWLAHALFHWWVCQIESVSKELGEVGSCYSIASSQTAVLLLDSLGVSLPEVPAYCESDSSLYTGHMTGPPKTKKEDQKHCLLKSLSAHS